MDIFEYCKESYILESSRRNDLRDALNLPIGLSIVLLGAVFALLSQFEWTQYLGVVGYTFGLLSILNSISLALVIANLIRAHVNYEYSYVPTSKEVLEYQTSLISYYQTSGNTVEAESLAEADTAKYMAEQFAINAHINFFNNNQKSGFIHASNFYLVASLVITLLSGAIFLLQKWMG